MKHDFDDSTIINANEQAVKNLSYAPNRITTTYLRGFLNALPEPQDDWQECRFEDIRKGDRVREVVDQGNGTFETTEGVASVVTESNHSDGRSWRTADRIYELACDDYALDYHKVTLYRIPKPVVHPDPAEHPVIIVHLHNGIKETKRAFVWNGESYGCLDGPHSFLAPHQITDWSPAKVVEDDR